MSSGKSIEQNIEDIIDNIKGLEKRMLKIERAIESMWELRYEHELMALADLNAREARDDYFAGRPHDITQDPIEAARDEFLDMVGSQ